MWIPEPLYRRLPAIYVGTGMATAFLARDSIYSVVSVISLFGASALITYWRHRSNLDRLGPSDAEKADEKLLSDYVASVFEEAAVRTTRQPRSIRTTRRARR